MINIFDLPIMLYALKFIFVTGAVLYLIYHVIVFRQIQIMKNTLITSFSPMVNLLGLINLLLAVALFGGFVMFL